MKYLKINGQRNRFDHSHCQAAKADDALDVNKPSYIRTCGKQRIMRDTQYDGKFQ